MSGNQTPESDTPDSVSPERRGIMQNWGVIALFLVLVVAIVAALLFMRPAVQAPTTTGGVAPAAPPSMGQPWKVAALPAAPIDTGPGPDIQRPPAMAGALPQESAYRPRLSPMASLTRATIPGQPSASTAAATGQGRGAGEDGEARKLAGLGVLTAEYLADAHRYLMPGDTIQCRNTQPLTERSGARFSVLLPEGARGRDGVTQLVPKGSRALGYVATGMQHGERRMAAILTHIEGPTIPGRKTLFVPIGQGQAGDALGAVDLAGNVETHFWSRLGAVAAYAALDMVARTGSAVAGGAINDAVNSGGRGQTNVNVGNFGGMGSGSGLAGQAFDHEIQRKPEFNMPHAQACTIFIQQPIHFPG